MSTTKSRFLKIVVICVVVEEEEEGRIMKNTKGQWSFGNQQKCGLNWVKV
jgi:hypothetical protein